MISSIETYKIFSGFYDTVTKDFDDDFRFYLHFCRKPDKIIEIGCGTGRILEYLIHEGYANLTGVDISQGMLDKAESKLANAINAGALSLFNHDFTFEKFNDSFDVALITYYTFNYVLEHPASFLKNVFNSINKKRFILLDLLYPNSLFDPSIDDVWIEKEYRVNGKVIPCRDRRTVKNNIETRNEIFSINGREIKMDTNRRYFSPSEIKDLLNQVGFHEIEFAFGYRFDEFSTNIDEKRLERNYIVKAIK